MSYDRIPQELKDVVQWVVWKEELRGEKSTKVPKVGTGKAIKNASVSDRKTWRSFKSCVNVVQRGHADGIGFVFSTNDTYIGIDLDNKEEDPIRDDIYKAIIKDMQSYAERSPSGTGYHIIYKGTDVKAFNNKGYELYPSGRFFTFTGEQVSDTDTINDDRKRLKKFIADYGPVRSGEDRFTMPKIGSLVEGSRNDTLLRVGSSLMGRGFTMDEIATHLEVYNRAMAVEGKALPQKEVDAILRSVKRYQKENEDEFGWLIDNLVYLANQERYYDKRLHCLHSDAGLNKTYHNQMPMSDDGKRIAPSKVVLGRKDVPRVYDIGWSPADEQFYTDDHGREYYNTYRPPTLQPKRGKAEPWLNHLHYLVGDRDTRNAILDWMAFVVQYPAKKINYGLFLGGPERIGKDLLMTPLRRAVGEHNHREISADQLESSFNEYLMRTKLLTVGEMHTNVFNARKIENKLKQMLTAPPYYIAIDVKGEKLRQIPNVVAVVFMSNHRDALNITGGNAARYLCHWCDVERLEDSYYAQMFRWVEDGGDAIVYDYLLNRDISKFQPAASALRTAFVEEIVEDSKPWLLARVEEMLDRKERPFHVDLISLHEDPVLPALDLLPNQSVMLSKVLRQLGCVKMRAVGRVDGQLVTNNLWVLRRHAEYEKLNGSELIKRWQKARVNKLMVIK